MRAIWLENQRVTLKTGLSVPVPQPGEALIRVRLAGVCSTDLELLRGYYPFQGIPGHEFVGEVVEAPGFVEWLDKRVVGEINLTCGECNPCRQGNTTHCVQRKALGIRDWNGAFAEYLVLPVQNLHEIPENVPDEAAVFTEPLAAAFEILEQIPFSAQQHCLVIGAGRLGQLIAQVIRLTGCKLQVVARHPHQISLLEQIDVACISEADIAAGTVDIVVEATGTPGGFYLARKAVRPRGIIVLKSTYRGDLEVNFSSIVVDEITLIGSRCGPFPQAIQALASGKIDPRGLIQACFPLEQGLQALDFAAKPGGLKVLINPLVHEMEKLSAGTP